MVILFPVEQHIRLTVEHLAHVHLRHVLVVKLVPLLRYKVLAVRRVVTACNKAYVIDLLPLFNHSCYQK